MQGYRRRAAVHEGAEDFINVSSVAGHKIGPGGLVYSATKHAVRVISEGLRQEVKPYNIRTTIISPGAVATELPNSITAASTSQAIHDLYKKYIRSPPTASPAACSSPSQPAGGRGRERDPIQAYVAGIMTAAFARPGLPPSASSSINGQDSVDQGGNH
jgi:NAD(P)-dependent dehydrogenase (short-subunit alcohol dehydrogenase family)